MNHLDTVALFCGILYCHLFRINPFYVYNTCIYLLKLYIMEEPRVQVIEENELKESVKDEIDVALEQIAIEEKEKSTKRKNKIISNEEKSDFIQDSTLKKIILQAKEQKKDQMRKRLYAKIRVMKDNRATENDENIQYNEKGKKVGRVQKQYLNIPQGKVDTPFEVEKIRQLLLAVGNNPDMKRQFLEKSGLPDDVCRDILASVKDENESKFDKIEEII